MKPSAVRRREHLNDDIRRLHDYLHAVKQLLPDSPIFNLFGNPPNSRDEDVESVRQQTNSGS